MICDLETVHNQSDTRSRAEVENQLEKVFASTKEGQVCQKIDLIISLTIHWFLSMVKYRYILKISNLTLN